VVGRRGVRHPEPPGQVPQAERTQPVLGDGPHRLLDGGVAQVAVMVGTLGRAHPPSIGPPSLQWQVTRGRSSADRRPGRGGRRSACRSDLVVPGRRRRGEASGVTSCSMTGAGDGDPSGSRTGGEGSATTSKPGLERTTRAGTARRGGLGTGGGTSWRRPSGFPGCSQGRRPHSPRNPAGIRQRPGAAVPGAAGTKSRCTNQLNMGAS